MIETFPKSWDALDKPPHLRKLTDSESEIVHGVSFPKTAFTPRFANELITLYAKAVGYETVEQVYDCMRRVGFWDYETWEPVNSEEVIDPDSINCDWRIGSPDWDSTKLCIQEDMDNRVNLRAEIYSNTPYDERGLSDRDIRIGLYFAEMAFGYLELQPFASV